MPHITAARHAGLRATGVHSKAPAPGLGVLLVGRLLLGLRPDARVQLEPPEREGPFPFAPVVGGDEAAHPPRLGVHSETRQRSILVQRGLVKGSRVERAERRDLMAWHPRLLLGGAVVKSTETTSSFSSWSLSPAPSSPSGYEIDLRPLLYSDGCQRGTARRARPRAKFKRVSNPDEEFGSAKRRSKRTTGLEPATSSLGSSRSTN